MIPEQSELDMEAEESSRKRVATDSPGSSPRKSEDDAKRHRTGRSSDDAAPSNASSSSSCFVATGNSVNHGWNSIYDYAVANGLEPWGSFLPHCALLKIFHEVVEREGAFAMLFGIGRVNRKWNDLSRQSTILRTLDLSFGWIKKQEKVLEQIINSINLSQLREINLAQWKNLTNSGIQMLSDNCPLLTSIRLSGTRVNSVGLSYLMDKCSDLNSFDLSALKTDAPHGRALQHFLESRGSNVRSLNMSSNCLKDFSIMMKLISTTCSQLRMLDVSNVQFTSDLVMFDVDSLQNCCSYLQILRLANAPFHIINSSEEEQDSSPGFPHLLELDVGVSGSNRGIGSEVSNNFLRRILKNSYGLKSLGVSGCRWVTSEGLQSLPATDLQRLYISNSSAANYEGVEKIMMKWQQSLIVLDLSWNVYSGMLLEMAIKKLSSSQTNSRLEDIDLRGTQISCARVQSLLEACPRLNCLHLDSCRGVLRGMKKEYSGPSLEELRRDIASLVAIAEKDEVNTTRDLCIRPVPL